MPALPGPEAYADRMLPNSLITGLRKCDTVADGGCDGTGTRLGAACPKCNATGKLPLRRIPGR